MNQEPTPTKNAKGTEDLRASLCDLDAKHENFLERVRQFVPTEMLPPDFHKNIGNGFFYKLRTVVKLDGVFARSERLLAFPAKPLQIQEVVKEDRRFGARERGFQASFRIRNYIL